MQSFEFGQDKKHRVVKRLAPDIPEQLELASRIDYFLQGTLFSGIDPIQRTRVLKDYRSPRPGGGVAHVSVGYSDTLNGPYKSEIQINHKPAGAQLHYALLGDGESWLKTEKHVRGKPVNPATLNLDHMLDEMQEYAPNGGALTDLMDRVATTRALVSALFHDMSPGAHYKAGGDHYRTTIANFANDGYTAARRIELVDGRVNNKIKRRLTVAALANFTPGSDIDQELVYGVQITKNGAIRSDGIQLVHTSSDGLSPQALANLAETSDVIPRRMDILRKALEDLSEDRLKKVA